MRLCPAGHQPSISVFPGIIIIITIIIIIIIINIIIKKKKKKTYQSRLIEILDLLTTNFIVLYPNQCF